MRCASCCYRPKRTRRTRVRWTWRQRRGIPGSGQKQWPRSKPDYFLFREKDRRRIKYCRWIQPRHHDSDHRALVADIRARPGETTRYVEGWVRLPVQPPTPHPPPEEQTKGEKLFAELSAAVEEVPRRERKSCEWIRDGTWRLLDQRASLRKQGRLLMVQGQRLGRRIRASFQSDRDYRALQAGHAIMADLGDNKVMAAWGRRRGWHKEFDPVASKPCYQALDRGARGSLPPPRPAWRPHPFERTPHSTSRPSTYR